MLTLHAADPLLHNFFCKPRTTLGMVMKLFPKEQIFRNILILNKLSRDFSAWISGPYSVRSELTTQDF